MLIKPFLCPICLRWKYFTEFTRYTLQMSYFFLSCLFLHHVFPSSVRYGRCAHNLHETVNLSNTKMTASCNTNVWMLFCIMVWERNGARTREKIKKTLTQSLTHTHTNAPSIQNMPIKNVPNSKTSYKKRVTH